MSVEINSSPIADGRFLHPMKLLYVGILVCIGLALLFFGVLSLMIVPAPNADTAFAVSGTVKLISDPHPAYGDMTITFTDGRRYYVNRANELTYFAWEQLLQDVQVGDTLYLTVVKPKAWQLVTGDEPPMRGPVAGVWTDSTVYLDTGIPAETWRSQATAVRSTIIVFVIFIILLLMPLLIQARKTG